MEWYCPKRRKHTENINPQVSSSSNGKITILSKCAICNSKKSRSINQQEAKRLLSKLGIKTPLSKMPILGDILFWMHIKMNEIVNKFLLAGYTFMPEMHLKQPGFTHSTCGPFTKIKERIKKIKKTGDADIYKNKLDKACFQHDMAYWDYKDLAKSSAADRILGDKAFKIVSGKKYDGYQRGLASMVYKLFDKKSKGSSYPSLIVNIKENIQ